VKLLYAGLVILSLAALYIGWKAFWFLTDDAHIAFRYVSNSLLGHGYMWNPPPFRPVEGYTSFLWVAILDVVWRVTEIEPPRSANILSLAFSALTILATVAFLLRMSMNERLRRFRPVFVAFVLLGTLSNRTFLAWTSSGLETAVFQFFFLLWVFCGIALRAGTRRWCLVLSTCAALTYLSRPDGLLVALATVAAMGAVYLPRMRRRFAGDLLGAIPLAAIVIHLVWRRAYYGAWLPNTYYAKQLGAWPESGTRYLTSFVLEYALLIWVAVAVVLAARAIGRGNDGIALRMRRWLRAWSDPSVTCRRIVVATLILHAIYYTFVVGGDHFEYRVYAHLIPVLFISFLWMVNRLRIKAAPSMGLLLFLVIASWPVPWTHWLITRDIHGRKDTHNMQIPVTEHLPSWMHFYTRPFDRLQSWLNDRGVCIRHQEHKEFYLHLARFLPPREEGGTIQWTTGDYPVCPAINVGVAGWVMPHVVIIDLLGLNDYVIARTTRLLLGESRIMAHDRKPPVGYVSAFRPNVLVKRGKIGIQPRSRELAADEIVAIEREWWRRAEEGLWSWRSTPP
jgi:arabinofuranosyltransferase